MTEVERKRAEERDGILEQLRLILAADRRIDAAWLFGSFGRGDADAWSDLDVVIVVPDDLLLQYLSERYDFVANLGEIVLTFESSYNGPPGGVYLMTGYDSPSGILLVDWYWQPQSAARMSKSNSILVSRNLPEPFEDWEESLVSLWQRPNQAEKMVLWNPTDNEDRANCAQLAWAMLAIQTKCIARKPTEAGLGFQEFIENLLAKAAKLDDNPLRFGDPSTLLTSELRLARIEGISAELALLAPASAGPAESFSRFLNSVKMHCAL